MAAPARPAPDTLLPPRTEVGVTGWMYANLFSSRFNTALTIVSGVLLLLALWFGLKWVFTEAQWAVVVNLGGRFIIGQYNTVAACPGQNCFWRPQVSLLMVTGLFGLGWGMKGNSLARNFALIVGVGSAAFALLPYGMKEMGLDVRLLLLANVPALAAGWALGRFTPLGSGKWLTILGVGGFVLTLTLLRGLPGVPGLQPVSVLYWGGLMLNLILAIGGIAASLPIGIALALGRRSQLPVVQWLSVTFIEVFRGMPLITLLFVSQVLVPLAFPENFPQNSLFRAGVVITLFSAAYMAENVRGGLQALDPGQVEAAQALGLPTWQITLRISLPQAIRNVIPAIVGQFIGLFKDTSLVYIIGMLDIVEVGRVFVQGNTEYRASARELFVFVAVVFWLFTYTMSHASRRIEKALGVGQR